jgi:hypothetical protein
VGGRLLFAAVTRLVFRPLLRSRRLDVAAARFELVAMVAPGVQATLSGRV